MSQWHRNHPELVGTDADPWMVHEDYRKLVPAQPEPLEVYDPPEDFCNECGSLADLHHGWCHQCRQGARRDAEE